MNVNSTGAVTQSAYWGLVQPWKSGPSFKTLALVLAALLIVIYFAHDGVRIAREHV